MDFTKLNLFKKFNDSMPIGLSSLGLKRKNKKSCINKQKKNKGIYPCFFKIDRVFPVAN